MAWSPHDVERLNDLYKSLISIAKSFQLSCMFFFSHLLLYSLILIVLSVLSSLKRFFLFFKMSIPDPLLRLMILVS